MTPSMRLPDSWVDSLLARMSAMYGEKFVRQWEKTDPAAMRDMWADALGPFDSERIKWALQNLLANNPFPPTLPEFVMICRQSPRPEVPALPAPDVPLSTRQQRAAELADAAEKVAGKKQDPKRWAREILANPRGFPAYSVKCAKEALGCDAESAGAR